VRINNYIKSLITVTVALIVTTSICPECIAKNKKKNNNIPLNDIITSIHKVVRGTTIHAKEYKKLELTLKPTRAGITVRF